MDVFLISLIILYFFISISNYHFIMNRSGEILPEDVSNDFMSMVESGDISDVAFLSEYEEPLEKVSEDIGLENIFRWAFSLMIILLFPFFLLLKISMFFDKKFLKSNAILFPFASYIILFILSIPINLFTISYRNTPLNYYGLIFGLVSLLLFLYGFSYLVIYCLKIVLKEEKLNFIEMISNYFKNFFSNIKFKFLDFIFLIIFILFILFLPIIIAPPTTYTLLIFVLLFFIFLINTVLFSYFSFRKDLSF